MLDKWKDLPDPDDEDREREEEDFKDKAVLDEYTFGSDKYHKGDYEGAIRHWSKALNMSPKDASIWWHRGNAKAVKGDHRSAIADFDESLRLEKGEASVWFSRGSSRAEVGDEEGAIADWEETVRRDETRSEVWCCLGTARLGSGDAAGAAAAADGAIRAEEDNASAWGVRGVAKLELSDFAGAAADLRKALALDSSLEWLTPKLEAALAEGGSEAAAATADDAIVPEPKVKALPDADDGLDQLSSEELEALIRGVYERQNPSKLPELDNLLRKYATALPLMYRQVCKKYGETPQVALRNQPEENKENIPQEVVAKEPVEAPPEPIRTHREMGNTLFKRGQFQEAIAEYKEACAAAEEGWVLALSNRAICHLKLGEHTEAVQVADLCLDQEGTHEVPLKVYLTKFKALTAQREWLNAFTLLRNLRARSLPPDVSAAAKEEERCKRRERVDQCAAAVGAAGHKEQVLPDSAQSLVRAVETVMPTVLEAFAREAEVIAACKAELQAEAAAEAEEAKADKAEQLPSSTVEGPEALAAEAEQSEQSCADKAAGSTAPKPAVADAAASLPLIAKKAELLGMLPEDTSPIQKSLKEVKLVTADCKFRVPNRELECYDTDDSSDEEEEEFYDDPIECALLHNVNLASDLERWVPIIRRLVITETLTIITGPDRDQSLVQNEDILLALGCDVKCPTTICCPNLDPGVNFASACENYHALVFHGGSFNHRLADDVPTMQRSLLARGFELPPAGQPPAEEPAAAEPAVAEPPAAPSSRAAEALKGLSVLNRLASRQK